MRKKNKSGVEMNIQLVCFWSATQWLDEMGMHQWIAHDWELFTKTHGWLLLWLLDVFKDHMVSSVQ